MAAVLEPKPVPSQAGYYPESDGQPMAENTKQFQWIVTIKENLDALLPNAFVAGDLFWYPLEGNNLIRQAPDVLVAFGRPKGHRGSYRQWEEDNIAPQVVFEQPPAVRSEVGALLGQFPHRHRRNERIRIDLPVGMVQRDTHLHTAVLERKHVLHVIAAGSR